MRIGSLRIKNFKSLRNFEMTNLKNLIILIGRNGSGKSNILEALYLLFSGMTDSVGPVETAIPDEAWSRQNPRSNITIEVELEFGEGEMPFSSEESQTVSWMSEEVRRLIMRRVWIRVPKKTCEIELLTVNHAEVINEGMPKIDEKEDSKIVLTAIKSMLQRLKNVIEENYKSIGLDRLVSPEAGAPGQRKAAIPQEIIQRIVQLENSPEPAHDNSSYELESRFNQLSGGDELTSTSTALMIRERRSRIPLQLSGAGTQTMLGIVYHLLSMRGIISIEEPEVHLHAELQRRIAQEFGNASKKAQIIITTHSTVFLDESPTGSIWHVTKKRGATEAKSINELDELKEITLALGVRPSDVLMANNVLFVEGRTDAIVLASWAELMEKNFKAPRVSIVPMRGANKGRYHLAMWNEIVKAAGIPRFMLLDGDEAGKKEARELIENGHILDECFHRLNRPNLEDYYPKELLKEILLKEFVLGSEFRVQLIEAINSKDCVKAVDNLLNASYSGGPKRWKLLAAKYVAEKSKKEDLHQEIRNLILRIEDAFA